MKLSESLEMTTWTADELRQAVQPEQIKKVKLICRITTLLFYFSYLLLFFGGGIYLKKLGFIPEETIGFKIIGLVVFLSLLLLLVYPVKFFTIALSAKLRIMPRRLARITLENWKLSAWEIAAAMGAGIGSGM